MHGGLVQTACSLLGDSLIPKLIQLLLPLLLLLAALLCLKNAKEGGLSSWTSSISVHNEIVRTRPDLAEVSNKG